MLNQLNELIWDTEPCISCFLACLHMLCLLHWLHVLHGRTTVDNVLEKGVKLILLIVL